MKREIVSQNVLPTEGARRVTLFSVPYRGCLTSLPDVQHVGKFMTAAGRLSIIYIFLSPNFHDPI